MHIAITEKRDGLNVEFLKRDYRLIYPENIWQNYPKDIKSVWIDNAGHLLTLNIPIVSKHNKLEYNTSYPLFKSFFDKVIIRSIPHAVEDYKELDTQKILRRFNNTKYLFADCKVKKPYYKSKNNNDNHNNPNNAVVVALSSGKDSLLSLAVSKEIGLKPVAVYINDTVSPNENKTKLEFSKNLCKEQKIKLHLLTNEIEKLNDFETWDTEESCVGYTHMLTGFCFITLPLVHYYNAKHIILGNQQNMNFSFVNKDGFLTYPSYDQTGEWMLQQNIMIKEMTDFRCDVASVIEPLTNIPIIKILFSRYPEFAKYLISCDCLDGTNQDRWCHECNKCARISLMIHAVGKKPETAGFKPLMDKKHKKMYCLFNQKAMDCYEKSVEARDEQLLAFYMAYKNDVKGYLIELFKKEYLKEAVEREDELFKRFFRVYEATTLHGKMKKEVESIYKEEINGI